ncbi:MAG: type II toxin-antitoxin system VapC family toxin [Candidatus Hydrogenedentes bacterium]|nr:type II toxin-antitoxin system VapC family toxin [Candidatus Hydrogenedentota bacterium]
MNYLLDTCVISELAKRAPNANVIAWIESRKEETLFLSVLTLGEIQKGIAKHSDDKRKKALQRWLDGDLRERFSDRVLPITERTALVWGQLQGEAERRGSPIPTVDGLLGATAIAEDLVVVTRNEEDIVRTGARILNPWE